MTRGQLPKAFLRVDPDIDQKHPDNLEGFIRLLCVANRQVPRGRFSSRIVLDRLFGKSAVDKLAKRGDIRAEADGTIVVPGWQTWQEGDFTVAERMRRYRQSKGGIADEEPSPTVAGGVTQTVTDAVTVASPTSEASRRQGVKASRRLTTNDAHAARAEGDEDPYDQAVTWLAGREAWIREGSTVSVDLARMVDKKGADVVIDAMSKVAGAEDAAQFVYGARNLLYPLTASQTTAQTKEQREEQARAERRRALGLPVTEGAR